MRYSNENVINSSDVSQSSNSRALDTSQVFRVSAQAVATGSPSATVKLQVSNDQPQGSGMNTGGFTPTNWSDLVGSSVSVNSATTFLIPSVEVCYRWIRVSVVGGGTGTLQVRLQSQAV